MASNYSKSLYNDYEKLLEKFEEQGNLLKETNKLIKSLYEIIDNLSKELTKERKKNEEQAQEILRLKSNTEL